MTSSSPTKDACGRVSRSVEMEAWEQRSVRRCSSDVLEPASGSETRRNASLRSFTSNCALASPLDLTHLRGTGSMEDLLRFVLPRNRRLNPYPFRFLSSFVTGFLPRLANPSSSCANAWPAIWTSSSSFLRLSTLRIPRSVPSRRWMTFPCDVLLEWVWWMS